MGVVFIHPHGPSQFRFLAAYLAARGEQVTLISERVDASIPSVRFLTHEAVRTRSPDSRMGHLAVADLYVQRGYRVAELLENLRRREGPPRLVVGHIGWGSLLFVKDALPQTPALGYCEYYFRPKGGDLGFDPDHPASMAELGRARVRNMVQHATLDAIEAGVSPTAWQRSRYPSALWPRIATCHEGVDLALCRPDDAARFELPDGRVLRKGDAVITYVARGLEPYRGFPTFIRAAAKAVRRLKNAIVVVAGEDVAHYGRSPRNGSWRDVMLHETGIDPARIVFLGQIDHERLVRLFQVSAVHVYLTVPFVLSWSMLEAMACGCLMLASRTAPVVEVITDGANGILFDFFDSDELARQMVDAITRPASRIGLRRAARATVEGRFDRVTCLAQQIDILARVSSLADRRRRATL